jgi:ADP-ribose pyrophosphatase YjhB (NUDIX family)
MIKNNNTVLIGGVVLFKDVRGKRTFLVVKQTAEENWELPKVTVRKGESSVRAVLRLTGELSGISAKVLEEAGRSSGVASVGGRVITQKYFYYLMIQKSAGEMMGFPFYKWFDYAKTLKTLNLKREKDMLKQGKEVLTEWEKIHKKK